MHRIDKTSLKQFLSIFFFSIFPILSLYLYNHKFVDFEQIVRPIIISVLMGLLVFALLTKILKNRDKAFLLSFLVGILFFTYGHVYFFLKDIIRHRYLVVIWAVIFFIGCWIIIKRISNTERITEVIFIASMILFIYPIIQVGVLEVNKIQKETEEAVVTGSRVLPDIYYITLDGYARSDVIEREFNYDNEPFISALEDRGFLVGVCSQSNYPWTHLSLTSSLNLNYLNSIKEVYHDSLQDAAIWSMLKEAGYTIITLDGGLSRVVSIESDVQLAAEESPLLGLSISEFEVMLMDTSMGLLLIDSTTFFSINLQPAFDDIRHKRLYTKTIFTLDELKNIADEYDSPKFIYTHILVPHDPYIFSPEGEYIHEETDMYVGYINSIKFLNPRILDFVDAIIDKSKTPPVIILQSDHGWTWDSAINRLSILNAYYLPEGGDEIFYDSISPINTFRSIFNYYWGTDFEILEDKSYFSPLLNVSLDEFEFVPNICVSQIP